MPSFSNFELIELLISFKNCVLIEFFILSSNFELVSFVLIKFELFIPAVINFALLLVVGPPSGLPSNVFLTFFLLAGGGGSLLEGRESLAVFLSSSFSFLSFSSVLL